jgi:hypothetical protein
MFHSLSRPHFQGSFNLLQERRDPSRKLMSNPANDLEKCDSDLALPRNGRAIPKISEVPENQLIVPDLLVVIAADKRFVATTKRPPDIERRPSTMAPLTGKFAILELGRGCGVAIGRVGPCRCFRAAMALKSPSKCAGQRTMGVTGGWLRKANADWGATLLCRARDDGAHRRGPHRRNPTHLQHAAPLRDKRRLGRASRGFVYAPVL